MNILGLNAFHADSSAALVRDGVLVAAAEEERFRRVKHWAGFPAQSIAYCLGEAGLRLSDLDHVAVNLDGRAHRMRKIEYLGQSSIQYRLGAGPSKEPAADANEKFPSFWCGLCRGSPFAPNSIRSSTIWRICPRRSTSRRSRRRWSSRSMVSAILPARPGVSAGERTSTSGDGSIFRTRSAFSTRRSLITWVFLITVTNTRSWAWPHMESRPTSKRCAGSCA